METENNSESGTLIDDSSCVDGENVFYFESDHLALRGNRDYCNVLRTVAILEAQRVRVQQQIEELSLAKQQHLEEPELFVQKLARGEIKINSDQINIAKLPEISTNYEAYLPLRSSIKEEPGILASVPKVRGRIVDNTKSETFNQLWTCEEQRELERLLVEHPVEEVEMRRYAKIAKALGNRTPQQVFSRVQKYFQKLHDAGMPVPGRKPKHKRSGQTKRKHFYRPSTFFPAYNVPVSMPDDDFLLDSLTGVQSPAPSSHCSLEANTPDAIEAAQRPDVRERTVKMLKAIRDEKNNTIEGYNPDPLAAKCEICLLTPVAAARWHCNTCYCAVNLCSDCLISQLMAHKFEHIMHDVTLEQNT